MEGWHLDKKVPLALVAAIVGQTLAAVWFASAMHSRVGVLEERVSAMADQRDRIIRMETILDRIEKKIDRAAQ